MQRILVMGSSGSGKSTFSKRLSKITGIPLVSLDALFWKPGWVEGDRAEFRQHLIEAVRKPDDVMLKTVSLALVAVGALVPGQMVSLPE